MPINTKLEGNPESIRGVSHWLRTRLKQSVSEATDRIYETRNKANAGWSGTAGKAFSSKMSTAARKTDDFTAATTSTVEAIEQYAAKLQQAQEDMHAVRKRAVNAGLTVSGQIIEEPGPAPATPGDRPTGKAATDEALAAHTDAVAAADNHTAKMAAYERAQEESDAAKHLEKVWRDTLTNVKNDLTQKWFITVGDLANGTASTLAAKHSSILQKQAGTLSDEAADLLNRANNAPAGTAPSQVYDDLDRGKATMQQADDVAKSADKVDASSAKWGFRASGALAAGGVVYDIANGKPWDQAVVSGGVSFGASTAAGAAIGTAIPVPVLGTAVGAIGGAAVGVFASGMTDSLWQNGVGELGGAIEDGAEAVGQTGAAVGGLAKDAWNAVF